MNNQIERRNFLKKAGIITAGLLSASSASMALNLSNKELKIISLLNPAFNVNIFKNGELELFTFLKDKSKLSRIYTNFEADVIVEILHHRNPALKCNLLALKYNFTSNQSRKKLNRVLKEFEKSGIIFYGDDIIVRITEKNTL